MIDTTILLHDVIRFADFVHIYNQSVAYDQWHGIQDIAVTTLPGAGIW